MRSASNAGAPHGGLLQGSACAGLAISGQIFDDPCHRSYCDNRAQVTSEAAGAKDPRLQTLDRQDSATSPRSHVTISVSACAADRWRCRTSAALNPNPQSNSRQSMSDVASEWRMPSRQRPSEKEPARAHPRRSHATLNGRPVPGARKCHDACGGCPRSRCRIAVPDQRGPLRRPRFCHGRASWLLISPSRHGNHEAR
jgi:hypothetical protein